jgi:hypothetical protein
MGRRSSLLHGLFDRTAADYRIEYRRALLQGRQPVVPSRRNGGIARPKCCHSPYRSYSIDPHLGSWHAGNRGECRGVAFEYLLPGAAVIWHLLDAAVSFAIVVGLFASIFKIIPDVHIDWQDVWVGSVVTAILFVAGKTAIGFYLGRSGVGSAYGAAGSILIMLAWVYYSSQILFFGAEFTKFHAEQQRYCVRPVKGVEAVTKEAEDRQRGIMPSSPDHRDIA